MTKVQAQSEVGLIGLAVMGENLALNIAGKGFSISVFNRSTDKVRGFLAERVNDEKVFGAMSIEDFVASLQRPRRIILMVKAGAPVDSTIETLLPHLDSGDMIIDAGNSHPQDSERRSIELEGKGFRFVGMGVSGGEEGALKGPSIMPGGSAEAYAELQPLLEKIAAQVDDGPCVTHIGSGAAGHFVKMVHNGIEYGDMQLIAETFDFMEQVLGMQAAEMAEVFAEWNRGPLESFLIEISADILAQSDEETGKPMVDVILDRAGQKGTGKWTCELALEYGVPLPTIQAAVEARGLSAKKQDRERAAQILAGPPRGEPLDRSEFIAALHDALYASKICSYAQGLDLLSVANAEKNWGLNLGEIARIWQGGCIIRARFLKGITAAYAADPELPNLLLDASFRDFIQQAQARWRQVVAAAALRGVPVLAMADSLSYFDSFRRARLPQSLTQAQRDYFGAHTFERVDRPAGESFHRNWY
ncbi:MAG: NADP-dependent phosphogluconate dehydrogenase [Planctomycetota bacterium]|jgi:6-phosphogluconate dehydrogenase